MISTIDWPKTFIGMGVTRLALPALARFNGVIRCLLMFLLVATLREALIRAPVMDGFAIAALSQFVCAPFIGATFGRILESISYLSHDEVYKAPYGWQIEVPAYITYIEPVASCILMAALASMGQFFLESLALALLTTFNWRFTQKRSS